MKGKQPEVLCKQKDRQRQTAFGSVNFQTGELIINFEDCGNYQTFKKHLKKVENFYKSAPKIVMIVDNVKFHHAKKLTKYLETQEKIEIMYLPAYSPDLNPIERVWWYMRKRITHNRFISTLEDRKVKFWKMFSHFQKPNDKIKDLCVINY